MKFTKKLSIMLIIFSFLFVSTSNVFAHVTRISTHVHVVSYRKSNLAIPNYTWIYRVNADGSKTLHSSGVPTWRSGGWFEAELSDRTGSRYAKVRYSDGTVRGQSYNHPFPLWSYTVYFY